MSFNRRFYPVGAQQAEFDVARARQIKRARALRAEKDLRFEQNDRTVRLEVASIVDYEVIALT